MIGPNSSGRIAATSSTAQPPWQLPMTQGLPSALGMQRDDLLEEHRLGVHDVFDGLARHRLGREADEVAGWPARIATPSSLSALKPPMPGPCPARGSTTTNGRFSGSTVIPARRLDRAPADS